MQRYCTTPMHQHCTTPSMAILQCVKSFKNKLRSRKKKYNPASEVHNMVSYYHMVEKNAVSFLQVILNLGKKYALANRVVDRQS